MIWHVHDGALEKRAHRDIQFLWHKKDDMDKSNLPNLIMDGTEG